MSAAAPPIVGHAAAAAMLCWGKLMNTHAACPTDGQLTVLLSESDAFNSLRGSCSCMRNVTWLLLDTDSASCSLKLLLPAAVLLPPRGVACCCCWAAMAPNVDAATLTCGR